MKLIRIFLLLAGGVLAWRALHGRGRQVLQRALDVARREAEPEEGVPPTASSGSHTSAASAANEDFRDDRDVMVGDNLSAVGIRPGGLG